MRYGTIVSALREWVALKLGLIPLPILDVMVGPTQARALMVAGRTGVLARLAEGPVESASLARQLALDPECLRLLLRVLRAMGYAELKHDAWSLSPVARRFFGRDASQPYDAFLGYGPPQWTMIEQLEQVLASGRGIDFHDLHTPEEWARYQAAMFENARAFSWFVRENLPVPKGATKCLDIAGSHGWVGAELCRKHRGLRSTVIDRAEAIAHAVPLAHRHGYHHRLDFREADLRSCDFGSEVDVALLCNILHHFSADQNRAILARLHRAMRPGAVVGLFEIETPEDHAPADAAGDAFALYFRITSSSTCFRGTDYLTWLRDTGYRQARIVRSVRMPSRMLVVATA